MKVTLYRHLPDPVQRFIRRTYSLVPPNIRMGSTYRATKRLLNAQEYWDRERIERWQIRHIGKMLRHAYDNVPGYRQLYDEAGVKPEDFRTAGDIRKFPFVTKELLRDNIEDFSARNIPRWKRLYRTTGGSTGIPFGFYLLQENIEREFAFLHSAWERAGWKLGDSSAVLRGAFIGSEENLSEYDPYLKELKISSYFLNERTYDRYKKRLLESRPAHLQAYPSAAALFADLILKNEDAGTFPFKLLLLGSENLYNWQKDRIGRAFPDSRIFGWYGHAEQVLFAPMCEDSSSLHLDPFYGFAELIDAEGNEVGTGATGELAGTSFWNFATPFIRYRTMDLAAKGSSRCVKCGRSYQLLEKIEGRLQELIVTGTGRYISMTAINMHSDVFDNVKQFQFRQMQAGKVTFNVVRKSSYSDSDTGKIRAELTKKLGRDMKLDIAFVDSIEVPKSGKFRFLIQELPISYGDNDRP